MFMNELDLFVEYFCGVWENTRQATKYSSRFSRVVLNHELLVKNGDKYFYIEHAYKYKEHCPYAKFVTKPVLENDKILLYSYKQINKDFAPEDLKDLFTFFSCKRINKYTFAGGTENEVVRIDGNKKYKFSSSIILSKTDYIVNDRGISLNNNEQIIGSEYGPFKFQKQKQL